MSSPLSLGGSTEQVTTGRHAQHHPSQAAGALLSNHHHPVRSQLWPKPTSQCSPLPPGALRQHPEAKQPAEPWRAGSRRGEQLAHRGLL